MTQRRPTPDLVAANDSKGPKLDRNWIQESQSVVSCMFIMILHVLTAWSSTSSDGDFDAGRRSTSSLLFFLILMVSCSHISRIRLLTD